LLCSGTDARVFRVASLDSAAWRMSATPTYTKASLGTVCGDKCCYGACSFSSACSNRRLRELRCDCSGTWAPVSCS
jgi:hypothetical protein